MTDFLHELELQLTAAAHRAAAERARPPRSKRWPTVAIVAVAAVAVVAVMVLMPARRADARPGHAKPSSRSRTRASGSSTPPVDGVASAAEPAIRRLGPRRDRRHGTAGAGALLGRPRRPGARRAGPERREGARDRALRRPARPARPAQRPPVRCRRWCWARTSRRRRRGCSTSFAFLREATNRGRDPGRDGARDRGPHRAVPAASATGTGGAGRASTSARRWRARPSLRSARGTAACAAPPGWCPTGSTGDRARRDGAASRSAATCGRSAPRTSPPSASTARRSRCPSRTPAGARWRRSAPGRARRSARSAAPTRRNSSIRSIPCASSAGPAGPSTP